MSTPRNGRGCQNCKYGNLTEQQWKIMRVSVKQCANIARETVQHGGEIGKQWIELDEQMEEMEKQL